MHLESHSQFHSLLSPHHLSGTWLPLLSHWPNYRWHPSVGTASQWPVVRQFRLSTRVEISWLAIYSCPSLKSLSLPLTQSHTELIYFLIGQNAADGHSWKGNLLHAVFILKNHPWPRLVACLAHLPPCLNLVTTHCTFALFQWWFIIFF